MGQQAAPARGADGGQPGLGRRVAPRAGVEVDLHIEHGNGRAFDQRDACAAGLGPVLDRQQGRLGRGGQQPAPSPSASPRRAPRKQRHHGFTCEKAGGRWPNSAAGISASPRGAPGGRLARALGIERLGSQNRHRELVIAEIARRHRLHLGRRDATQALDQAFAGIQRLALHPVAPHSLAWLNTESSL
jgi:hypothetical protein